MESVWIQSVHNLHCPTCGARLVERAGRYAVAWRARPVYVGEVGSLRCRAGHGLPDRETLYRHRDEAGHARQARVREVTAPCALVPAVSG